MKLYYHPNSPNSRKVLLTARELGMELELATINLLQGEQWKPWFAKLNPNQMIPTLVDGDFVLWESAAIMQYLASLGPPNSLWPEDVRIRADICRWQVWESAHFGPAVSALTFERLLKPEVGLEPSEPAVLERAEETLHRFAWVLDDRLRDSPYLAGTTLTLADLAVAATLTYAEAARLPLAEYRHIARFFKELASRESWRATAPAGIE